MKKTVWSVHSPEMDQAKREGCARRVLLVRELRKPKFSHDKVNPPQHLATSSFRNLRQRRVIVIDRKNTQTILTG